MTEVKCKGDEVSKKRGGAGMKVREVTCEFLYFYFKDGEGRHDNLLLTHLLG